jgi:hypothetical protein
MKAVSNQRVSNLVAWAVFAVGLWLVLRPVLTVTIVWDDFYNPIRLRELYGSSPGKIVVETVREANRNGHFNYVGQSLGALLYVLWDAMMSLGIRYSLIYAATKLVVMVLAIAAAGGLLRTLCGLLSWTLSPWRSRLILAAALVATMQLHTTWSFDPVGNFPLWGYLSAAIGIAAADLAIRVLIGTSTRSPWLVALGLCLAILYYEINVAMVFVAIPVVLVLHRRARSDDAATRTLWRRAAQMLIAPTVMTFVLALWARHANAGYEGTQTGLGSSGVKGLVKVIGGSLPGVSWQRARHEYGGPFVIVVWATLGTIVVGAVVLGLCARTPRPPARPPWIETVLVVGAPLLLWLVPSVVQGATVKVGAQTTEFSDVYMYYAYGSIGLPLAAIVVFQQCRGKRWSRLVRPLVLTGAIVFAFIQLTINEDLQRQFDSHNPGVSAVYDAYADQPSAEQRCATLALFEQDQPWATYYNGFTRSVQVTYRAHHGVDFCPTRP